MAEAPRPVDPSRLADALVSPLLDLRDDYLRAIRSSQSIVAALDALAVAISRQQRGPIAAPPAASQPERPPPPAPVASRLDVDVSGSDFGQLLDFQQRLSELAGVARVSIKAIENERATLGVELAPAEQQP